MNAAHLIGTLKFAPRFKPFNSGKAKTTAIIETPPAPGRQYGDKVDVSAWDDEAMALADLKQGDAVEIHGRITTESWDDKETGKKVYKQVVVATSVASPSRTVRAASATAKAAGRFDPDPDDSIPF
jgi:single-stranded DNA-binding protein